MQLISEYPLLENIFTDGSKTEEGVAAAAVSTKRINKPFTCRLPDNSSIYTAELRGILLALKHVSCSKGKSLDEFPENKLYKRFPVLKECISCPRKNRKEETVMARLHIGHSFLTHSFLLKGEEQPLCIGCDKRLTVEHILLTCSDFIEIRESHFTAKSLRMLFQDILPEKIFNFLKEINIFGKI